MAILIERLEQEEDLIRHKNHLQYLVEEQTLDLISKETELLSITESTPDVIIRFTNNGRILYFNNNIRSLFQKSPDEILGKSIKDLAFNEKIISFWENKIAEVLQIKILLEEDIEYFVNNLKTVLNIRMIPEFDESKNVISVLSVIRDITQQSIALESAIEIKKLYEIISANSTDLVCLHEADSKYVWISPSVVSILGYTQEEMIGQYPSNYFHPDDIQKILNPSRKKVSIDKLFDRVEYRIRKNNGEYIWFDTVVKPILDETNKVVYIQSLSRNITDRKLAEARLEEITKKEKDKKVINDVLTEIISHDIKITIENIVSELNNLKKITAESELSTNFDSIEKDVFQLKNKIEKISLFSDLSKNKLNLFCDEINIKQLVNNVFESNFNSQIQFTIFEHCDSVFLFSDEKSLKQIISIIIDNAVVYAKTSQIIINLIKNERNNLVIGLTCVGMEYDEKYSNIMSSTDSYELLDDFRNEIGINYLLVNQLVKINDFDIKVNKDGYNNIIFSLEIPYYKRVKIDPEPKSVKRGMIDDLR